MSSAFLFVGTGSVLTFFDFSFLKKNIIDTVITNNF